MRLIPQLVGAFSQEMNNRTIRRPSMRRERGRGRLGRGGSLACAALAIALLSLLEVTPVAGAFLPFPMKLAFNFPSYRELQFIEDQMERPSLLLRSRRNENIPLHLKSFFDMISNGEGLFEEGDSISASSEPETNSDPSTESEFNEAPDETSVPVPGPDLYPNPYAYQNPHSLQDPRLFFDPYSYPYSEPPLESESYPTSYPYPDSNSPLGPEPHPCPYPYPDTDSPLLFPEPYPVPYPYPDTDLPREHGSMIESHYQVDPDCTIDPNEDSDVIPEVDPHATPDMTLLASVSHESSAINPSMVPKFSDLTAIPSPSPTPESDSMSLPTRFSVPDRSSDSCPYSTPASMTKPKRRPPLVDPKSIVVDEHVEELEEDLLGPVLDIFAGPRLPSKNRATIFDLANTVLKAVESNKEEDVNRAKMKPEEKAEMFLPRKSGPRTSSQVEDNSPPNPKLLDITKAFLRMVKTDKRYEVREARKRDALRRAQEAIEREHAEREELMEQEKAAEKENAAPAEAAEETEQTGQVMQTEQIDSELEAADTSTQVT